ncbi:MAG: hypothetical protein JSV81_01285 [Anaerolineales bacterium]|nr:MAG: hypothetical protein JSV81_01285 [Anaerolineales bacterium]
MQRWTFARVPIVSSAALSLPPMHTWPTLAKQALLGVCVILCIIAYIVMATGIIGLATLILGIL